jgi:hypothetical protein
LSLFVAKLAKATTALNRAQRQKGLAQAKTGEEIATTVSSALPLNPDAKTTLILWLDTHGLNQNKDEREAKQLSSQISHYSNY